MANRKHARSTRLVAIISTFALVMGLLPFTAFADDPEGETGETPESEATIETQDTTAGLYIGATPGGTVSVKGTAGGSSTPMATIAEGTSSTPRAFASTTSVSGGTDSWGSQVELRAVPNAGYTFKGWSLNWNSTGATISNTNNPITVSIADYATYVAVFESTSSMTFVILCLGTTEGGTYGEKDPYNYGGSSGLDESSNHGLYSGDEVTVTATPATGYEFKGWYEGVRATEGSSRGMVVGNNGTLVSSNPAYTFTITADTSLQAVFTAVCTHTSLTKTEAVAATCTEEGTAAYWKCDDCGKLFSDAAATTEISAPVKVAALGHDWGEWVEADGKATRTCKRDSSHTETVDIAYSAVSGDGAEWTKGTGDALTFTFKRTVNDGKTFASFKGVKVDGADVAASNYATAEGSLILSFTTTYLETLSVGDHKVTASFEDGEASATFTVKAAPTAATKSGKTSTPATGDRTAPMGAMLLAAAMACGVLLVARNRMSAHTPTGKHARR